MIPNRIVGTVSYRKEYIKHLATTVSLFYEGASQGMYTYIVNGDLNNDGNNSTDLMYVPRDPSEIIFVDQPAIPASGINAFTAKQQSDAFFQFIQNNPALNKLRGQYVGRNGIALPWYDRVDFKVLQDLFTNIGKRKHSIQVSLDILNFTNMLNPRWGVIKATTLRNPLFFNNIDAAGRPTYRLTQIGGQLITQPFQVVNSFASTWSMQFGVRYIF